MHQRFIIFSLMLVASIALALAGCGGGGGGGPQYDDPIIALGGGAAKDISVFNGTNIYTIITPQPANKPEGNYLPPETLYSFTLVTSPGDPLPSRVLSPAEKLRLDGRLEGNRQIAYDLKMREMENRLLASRARQLSGRPTDPDRAPPATINIGTKWNDVNIFDNNDDLTQIDTTCCHISDHAYFFVDDRNIDAMAPYFSGSDGYGEAFDSIYEMNHTKFGAENDTDGNGKVIIVFSQELTGGLLGYFYSVDKFPNHQFSESNEGDIFYVTTDTGYQGDIVNATLAHEFQHMIYFDEHYDRGVMATRIWLNEALSQAAEYYNNYLDNHHDWIAAFLDEDYMLGLSLTHWTPINYGYGAVFIRYLIDQYGDAAIKNMCSTNKIGIDAVEAATGRGFNTIFNEFTRALVMSGISDSENPNPRYKFITLDLQSMGGLVPEYHFSAGQDLSGEDLPPYSIAFIQWSGNFGSMNLSGASMVGTVFGLSY